MQYTNSTKRLISRLVMLAGLICPVLTNAQDRARDMDPEIAHLRAHTRNAGESMVIRGMMGPLDYENAREPSQLAQPLFLQVDPNPEPLEAILKYQSRGQRVEINWDFLDSLRDGVESRVLVPFFDGRDRELVFVHSEYRGTNRYSWFGQIAGVAASDFILVRYDEVIFMTIRDYKNSLQYEVMFTPAFGSLPAGHALRKVADVAPPSKCGTCDGSHKHHHHDSTHAEGVSDEGHAGSGAQGEGGGGYAPRSAEDPPTVIDIMVLCTAQALAGFGSYANFAATAQACIDDANVRNGNSGTGLSFRLMAADTIASGYNEDADGRIDLDRLTYTASTIITRQNGTQYAPDPSGHMDSVLPLRDLYRADLVALIRQESWEDGTAGVAWRPDRIGTVQTPNNLTPFSVNCRNHSSLPLVGDIFAHEIGHNLGACHDAAQNGCGGGSPPAAITNSPQGVVISCDQFFCYDYWHSTMAYGPRGCFNIRSMLLPAWSNPNLLVDLPSPCTDQYLGNTSSDVTYMIQTTRPYVSQYRIAASQIWAQASSGNGGNGTRHAPFGRIRNAVSSVQGGVAHGVVQALGSTFDETASNGGPVLLTNPCKIVSATGAPVNIR